MEIARPRLLIGTALVLFVLGIVGFAGSPSVHAAVIVDNSTTAGTPSTTATSLSWSHTTSSQSDRIMVVGVSINGNRTVSTVTYAGKSLTRIATINSGTVARASLWYLLDPPAGAGTVNVTLSGAARFVAGATTYYGVNQSIPLGTPATMTGSSGVQSSLTLTSAPGEMVVDIIARRGDLTTNPLSASFGQAQQWNRRTTVNNANSGVTGGSSTKAGASTVIMNWSWPLSRAWATAGVSLKPVVIPGDTTPPVRFNGIPSGILAYDTQSTTLSVTTDENATCKLDVSSGILYQNMSTVLSSVNGGITHTQTLVGLSNGTTYTYYIKCVDSIGNANTNDYVITFAVDNPPPPPADTTPPTVPTNLALNVLSPTQIHLTWSASTDDTGVVGYKIYRDGQYVFTTSDVGYLDTELAEDTEYSYSVSATDASDNESAQSDSAMARTPVTVIVDTLPPSIPTNLRGVASSHSLISLEWDPSDDNVAVAGYKIFRNGTLIETQVITTHDDAGLDPSTTYAYTVIAFDTSGNESGPSNPVELTTLDPPPPPDTQAPNISNGSPSGVLPAETTSVTLSMETDEDATCRYATEEGVSYGGMLNQFATTGGTVHTQSLTSLVADTLYTYAIRCSDSQGNINQSDYLISFSVAPQVDTSSPSVPENLTLDAISPAEIIFSWSASTDNIGVVGYKIFRDGELVASTVDTFYTALGVLEQTTYSFTVSAYDSAGNESAQSSPLVVTTESSDTTPPLISEIMASSITANSVVISWTTDEPSLPQIEFGFTALYGQLSTLGSELSTSHSVTLDGLSPGTDYHYRVIARDGSDNMSQSFDFTFSTLPGSDTTPPSTINDLSVTQTFPTSVDLTWTAPGGDGSSGIASSYDLRFSTSPLTDVNWSGATPLLGLPLPSVSGSTETYVVVGLAPQTTYYFAIKAFDSAGNSAELSNVVMVQTRSLPVQVVGQTGSADTVPPAEPTNFVAFASDTQTILRWDNPADTDFVRVVLIRKEGSAPQSRNDGTVIYEGVATEFTDTTRQPNTLYYYGLYAYDRSLNYTALQSIQSIGVESLTQVSLEATSEQPVEQDQSGAESLSNIMNLVFTRNLSFGMRHAEVRLLQTILASDPSLYPEGLVTGYFGKLTREAVRKFQCKNSIICSGNESSTGYGNVGPKTRAVLNSLMQEFTSLVETSPPASSTYRRELFRGVRGDDVRALQSQLGGNPELYPERLVTGYFGILTERAVQRLQCSHNIVCEGAPHTSGYGRVGPKTLLKLRELASQ